MSGGPVFRRQCRTIIASYGERENKNRARFAEVRCRIARLTHYPSTQCACLARPASG